MKKTILTFAFLLTIHPAFAETAAVSSAQPVTISAAKSLEWNRKAQTYTARQDVVATQGTTNLHSTTLTAHYSDNDNATDITTMEAEGNVTIIAPPYTAYGDHAVYNVKTGTAELTGKDLKISSTDGSVLTAQKKIVYDQRANKMTAVGAPVATKGEDTLTADTMSASFTKDAAGKTTAQKITAHGNVTVKTPKETATGDDGDYDVPAQKAVLTGKVRILQDKSWLEGTRADIDMNTGISRLSGTGNAATEGRVTGVFYPTPKEQQPPEQQPQGQAQESTTP